MLPKMLAPKTLRIWRIVGGREWQRVEIVAAMDGEGDRDDSGDAVVDTVDNSGDDDGAWVMIRWQANA